MSLTVRQLAVLVAIAGCQQSKTQPEPATTQAVSAPSDSSRMASVQPDPKPVLSSKTEIPSVATNEPQQAGPNRKPTGLIFPSPAKFAHSHNILSQNEDGSTVLTLVFRADDEKILFMTDLFLKGKDKTLLETGQFRFASILQEWQAVNPSQITIRMDDSTLVFKCKRVDKQILAIFEMDELMRIISPENKSAAVQIDNIVFELTNSNIEGMRDLASRVPDGLTVYGGFTVTHERDKERPTATSSTKGRSPVQEANLAGLKQLKDELQSKIDHISEAKAALKAAMILDDSLAIAAKTADIEKQQKELLQFVDAESRPLYPQRFATGQIGELSQHNVRVMDLEPGEIVGHIFDGSSEKPLNGNAVCAVKLIGVDAQSIHNHHLKFDQRTNFIVVGEMKHSYFNGVQTVTLRGFELHVCEPFTFTPNEKQLAHEAADSKYKIELTDDEKSQAEAAREAHVSEMKEKESGIKARRSKSCLENGKILLRKDNFSGARKQFEKAIAEDPDSESAKEAAELIKKLP